VDEPQTVYPAAAAPQRRVDGDLRLICVHPMKIQFHYAAYHTGTSRFLSLTIA